MSSGTDITQVIRTRLYLPCTSGLLVPRPRLLERLGARCERPLALDQAPPGYGKTTLVNCWLEACDCTSAWVSLDEGDDDQVLFLDPAVGMVLLANLLDLDD